MAGFMKSLKRVFTSELLKKADIRIDDGDVRLTMRLKRDRLTHERYVVLGLVASMNYKHAELNTDEFQKFLEAAKALQMDMHIHDALPPLRN
jgi:hypothetical protein